MHNLSWISLLGTVVIAGSMPADKETLVIDRIDGKKGAVTFPHKKHASDGHMPDGSKIVCKGCHHTLSADEPQQGEETKPCTACHAREGEEQKEHNGKKARFLAVHKGVKIDRKSVIFHVTCLESCHKKVKIEGRKLKSCKICHRKKPQPSPKEQ